jgi:hypothetical protein
MLSNVAVAKKSPRPRKPKDVALVVGPTADHEGLHVLRRRDEDAPVELGTVRPLKEGEPIDGEVVKLRPRQDAPFVCDVRTMLPGRRAGHGEGRLTSDGPPQVATDDYRRGWEKIWGKSRGKDARLN